MKLLHLVPLASKNKIDFKKVFFCNKNSKNCSKERPGSIENKTLKNEILIPIDISKELDFYADFKYISFIKFSLSHQKL